ncbi:unnamed protein product [Sphagnum jensenii]|uniref:Uncharacterized protein n=1 Tax=Sphagnum jensenii TaxID=128206 RepID=A0ABP1A9W7_9BRYO
MGLYMPAHGLCLPSISGFVSRRSCRARAPLLSLSLSFHASLPRMVVGNKGSTEVQGLWMYPLTRFFLSQFLMQLL